MQYFSRGVPYIGGGLITHSVKGWKRPFRSFQSLLPWGRLTCFFNFHRVSVCFFCLGKVAFPSFFLKLTNLLSTVYQKKYIQHMLSSLWYCWSRSLFKSKSSFFLVLELGVAYISFQTSQSLAGFRWNKWRLHQGVKVKQCLGKLTDESRGFSTEN